MPPADNLTPGGLAPELRWVSVRDLTTGATRLSDNSSGQMVWTAEDGPPWRGGRPLASGGRITTGPRSWTDYELEVVVSNPVSLAKYARFQDAGDNTSIWMRP